MKEKNYDFYKSLENLKTHIIRGQKVFYDTNGGKWVIDLFESGGMRREWIAYVSTPKINHVQRDSLCIQPRSMLEFVHDLAMYLISKGLDSSNNFE